MARGDARTELLPKRRGLPSRRADALRTNLWLVPAVEIAAALGLFAVTFAVDQAVDRGTLTLPGWIDNGSADAARQLLIGMAAAVITVVGVVFSITIVALTMASTQMGPRILRNFVRDRATQVTLGTFVATFVYAMVVLGSVSSSDGGDFVPHLSITVALGLVLVDLAVLVFFIHHVARAIQLPEVIAGIARDLNAAVAAEERERPVPGATERGPTPAQLSANLEEAGAVVRAGHSGYLQVVGYRALVRIAGRAGAVIRILHRPGHFVVAGLPLAVVWPPEAEAEVSRALERAHVVGPNRTLEQDLAFAVDQLVEIALRALSPAVNDTFSALTCIDWLTDGLCSISARWDPVTAHRDDAGYVRVLAAAPSYDRLVDRAFDKIRQASRGMPAVMIRQLDALTKVMEHTTGPDQRGVLLAQGAMIRRASTESVPDPEDRDDVARRHDALLAAAARAEEAGTAAPGELGAG